MAEPKVQNLDALRAEANAAFKAILHELYEIPGVYASQVSRVLELCSKYADVYGRQVLAINDVPRVSQVELDELIARAEDEGRAVEAAQLAEDEARYEAKMAKQREDDAADDIRRDMAKDERGWR